SGAANSITVISGGNLTIDTAGLTNYNPAGAGVALTFEAGQPQVPAFENNLVVGSGNLAINGSLDASSQGIITPAANAGSIKLVSNSGTPFVIGDTDFVANPNGISGSLTSIVQGVPTAITAAGGSITVINHGLGGIQVNDTSLINVLSASTS